MVETRRMLNLPPLEPGDAVNPARIGAPCFTPILDDWSTQPRMTNVSHRVTLSRLIQPHARSRAGPSADAAARVRLPLVHP